MRLTAILTALTATAFAVLDASAQAQAPDTWSDGPAIPKGMQQNGCTTVAYGAFVYVAPGPGTDFYRFDPSSRTWTTLASVPPDNQPYPGVSYCGSLTSCPGTGYLYLYPNYS